MAVIVRPYEAADLAAMQQIRQVAFEPIFVSFRSIVGEDVYRTAFANADLEQARFLEGLCQTESNHQVYVAAKDGEIVGFVSFSLDRDKSVGEIGLNAVHPDHAGRGVGTSLYGFALARMKESGMKVATVGAGGDPSHAPARRAYEKAGFGPALPSVFLYRLL